MLATSTTMYDDAIASDWDLNGWGWSSSSSVVTSPAIGANAIRVTMNAAWSGFVFAHLTNNNPVNIDPATYGSLDFDINPGPSVAPALSSLLLDIDNGSNAMFVTNMLQTPLAPNTWSHAHVDLSALNSLNAPYYRLNYFNDSTITGFSFYIDNVVLGPTAPQLPPSPPSASGSFPPIAVARNTAAGQTCDSYTWYDDTGCPRTADFVDDVYLGGYIRRIVYQLPNGTTRTAIGGIDGADGYQGFGYLVGHYATGSNDGADSADSRDPDYSSTLKNNGHSQLLWQGRHHIIRRYTVDLHPVIYGSTATRGTVHATVYWLLATGRAPMLFSVTYDASPNGPNRIAMDSRAPYGNIAWDGTPTGSVNVSGVSWGDNFVFMSNSSNTSGNFTTKSAWTYNTANTIPFAYEWATSADAEMGIVDTRTFLTDMSAEDSGVWFDSNNTIHGSDWIDTYCWGKTSSTQTQCADPSTDGSGSVIVGSTYWPFQLINYAMSSSPTANKKIAWGSDYGAIGWQSVNSFGKRFYNGYPLTSYSTNVVLSRHTDQPALAEVHSQEAVRLTTLTATAGTIPTSGPIGVERSDIAAYSPAGYDPVYGAWRIQANASGLASFTSRTTSGSLVSPMIIVGNAGTAGPVVTLDGAVLTADSDYFASANGSEVWITLGRTLSGTHTWSINTR
ncbi:MAG: hypothetical protein FWD69_13600 [Polyangiaceae bacterium]|nr:hypothetical protein [Polyangiaceae bacterium]